MRSGMGGNGPDPEVTELDMAAAQPAPAFRAARPRNLPQLRNKERSGASIDLALCRAIP